MDIPLDPHTLHVFLSNRDVPARGIRRRYDPSSGTCHRARGNLGLLGISGRYWLIKSTTMFCIGQVCYVHYWHLCRTVIMTPPGLLWSVDTGDPRMSLSYEAMYGTDHVAGMVIVQPAPQHPTQQIDDYDWCMWCGVHIFGTCFETHRDQYDISLRMCTDVLDGPACRDSLVRVFTVRPIPYIWWVICRWVIQIKSSCVWSKWPQECVVLIAVGLLGWGSRHGFN